MCRETAVSYTHLDVYKRQVLEEAQDPDVPLLERMKFVAIFTSNLDEFFMIRVGSLYDMASLKEMELDRRSKMTPKEQLERIYEAVEPLYKERDKTYSEIKKRLSPCLLYTSGKIRIFDVHVGSAPSRSD